MIPFQFILMTRVHHLDYLIDVSPSRSKKIAQLGANATCRQQWTFVSRLRRDVPSRGASATQGDVSHFVAGALTDGAALPSGTPTIAPTRRDLSTRSSGSPGGPPGLARYETLVNAEEQETTTIGDAPLEDVPDDTEVITSLSGSRRTSLTGPMSSPPRSRTRVLFCGLRTRSHDLCCDPCRPTKRETS